MTGEELIGFAITFAGMAFGFGKQAANISTLRRDVDNIGKSHRDIMIQLQEIDKKLERLDQRVIYCEKDVS